jgi:hypothetical protein
LFTPYDQEIIKSLISAGNMDRIPNAIQIENQEQEKEVALLLASQSKPVFVEESEVRKEMLKLQTDTNMPIINSPEEEKAWQQKLNAEKAEAEKKIAKMKEKELASLDRAIKPKVKEVVETKKEVEKEVHKIIDSKLVLA